jgi:predicted ATPase
VPLFIEELTKMVLESGLLVEQEHHYELSGPLPPLAIPATLQDSLMARLDRLASAKTVVQLAATIGRSFSYALIEAVSALPHTTLQDALARLVQAELLYQQGVPPQATYLFKHALIQDTAYQSLLRGTRRQFHRQIGQVLVEHFAGLVETQPEQLAYHYTEAGQYEQGLLYWQRAGQRAVQHSAYVEAVHHLNRGLELLTLLPDTAARTHQELLLRTHLGPALMAVKGYAAPEVEHTYARARALCEQVEESPQLFPVLRGLYTYYLARADYQTVRLLVERLLTVAQLAQDTALLLEAHRALGLTLFYVGEFAAARQHLEQSFSLYDRQRHHAQAFLYGQDSGVVCLAFTALTLWVLGYPAQALSRSRAALALARDLSHPLSLALALDLAAGLQQFRREAQGVQEQADALVALASEHGFPFWRGTGTVKQGWAQVERGDGEAGIAAMHQGLAAVQATGISLVRPSNLARLAEAYLRVHRIDDGLRTVAEALREVHKSGEQYHEAELYRLQGELLLCLPHADAPQAEACLQRALEVARRQQARAWELRAATSLSRLWQQQGKHQAAREVLTAVYGWFTEGFDTHDLQAAQAQLRALRGRPGGSASHPYR